MPADGRWLYDLVRSWAERDPTVAHRLIVAAVCGLNIPAWSDEPIDLDG